MRFLFLIAFACAQVFSYEDLASDARFDYQQSDVVVAGRVVGVERTVEADEAAHQHGSSFFSFYAKVRVAASYKGEVKLGHDVLVYVGGYWAKPESAETSLAPALRNMGVHALSLDVGGVYVLSLMKIPGTLGVAETWKPRSQQASILPVGLAEGVPTVQLEKLPPVTLDQFIAEMKMRKK